VGARVLKIGIIAAAVVAAALALPSIAAKPSPTVRCTLSGSVVYSVSANQQFAVSGSGYKANLPVDVCFGTTDCALVNVDRDGEFYQVRTVFQPGSYPLTVKQARNSRLNRWDVKAVSLLTVTD
jgi:hypothetical protein